MAAQLKLTVACSCAAFVRRSWQYAICNLLYITNKKRSPPTPPFQPEFVKGQLGGDVFGSFISILRDNSGFQDIFDFGQQLATFNVLEGTQK